MNNLRKTFLLAVVLGSATLFSQRQYNPIPVDDVKPITKKKTKLFFEQYIPEILHPEDYLLLKEVFPMNETMEDRMGSLILEDQSEWKVKPSHVSRLLHWKKGHRIALTQNNTLFLTKFPYRLINYTLNQSIDVKQYSGPDLRCGHINVIEEIDYETGEIKFYNGRKGKMRLSDSYLYTLWNKEDVVMTGVRSGRGSDYGQIIINANCPQQLENGSAVLCNLVIY